MLILSRRLDETIMIGDDIRLTVLGVRGHQVRIGIDAPKDVVVHREEIYELAQKGTQNKGDNTAKSAPETENPA